MRITLFRDLPSEGWPSMERYADELAGALRLLGAEVSACTLPRPFSNAHGRAGALLNYVWRLTAYPLAARRRQGDVNHILDHSYAHLIRVVDPARTVITCHDLAPLALHERGRGLSRWMWDFSFRALPRAARIIADSAFTRAELLRLTSYPAKHITTVWLAVNPEFRPAPEAQRAALREQSGLAEHTVVLHVGSCAPRKNIEAIIDACGELQIANMLFVQVGGCFTSEQRRRISRHGLSSRVHQISAVTEAELRDWYHLADVFIFPSFYEGFGLPVLEAMACGLPVVCSNAGSLPEVAGEAALMVDPHDPAALANAIRALSDPALRARLIERGLARSREFTWERTARQTLAVYAQVAEGR